MKRVILIAGGARSGKSCYAVKLAKKLGKKVIFIATAVPTDKEMKERIRLHKLSRPRNWRLIEEGKDIDNALSKLRNKHEIVLIDCLGFWISNLLADNLKDRAIERKIESLINVLSKIDYTVILVSNEVGGGIVPENYLARRFRDLLGLANQMLAKEADEVILMQLGIPMKLKGEKYAKIK